MPSMVGMHVCAQRMLCAVCVGVCEFNAVVEYLCGIHTQECPNDTY